MSPMARRRQQGLIEEVFDNLQQCPWWIGVITAAVFWIFGQIFLAHTGSSQLLTALRPIIKLIFNGLAILSLVAAVISPFKSRSRRRLLDRQEDIESIRALSWQQFEQLAGEAYRRDGYTAEETGGGGADGGIDLVLRGNGETILVQCKRWRSRKVGVDKVRELYGILVSEGANRGILVSSGHFTNDAKSFSAGKPLTLIDGSALVQLVHDVQSTVTPKTSPSIPQAAPAIPSCPRCGNPMVLRTARSGANAGSQFYGCPSFPQCRGTRPAV